MSVTETNFVYNQENKKGALLVDRMHKKACPHNYQTASSSSVDGTLHLCDLFFVINYFRLPELTMYICFLDIIVCAKTFSA